MKARVFQIPIKLALICVLAMTFAVSAEAHGPYRGGGRVVIVPRVPYYYPYWGYGWGGWGWGAPYWDYGPYYSQSIGWIKIKDRAKSDEILINDAYAGTVDKMKTIGLDPGRYTIHIRRDGKILLSQTVYVVSGKTITINMDGA